MHDIVTFEPGDDVGQTSTYAGTGILTAALLALIPMYYYSQVRTQENRSGFATYEASLRKRLDICVDGLKILDCATVKQPSGI